MPTYEYVCKTCSHRFETWQKMTDEPLTICPECGGSIRRVLFPAGVVFKGSGFYKTDHGNGVVANGKSEEGAKAESTGTASEGSAKSETPAASNSSSGTSESKPAATSDSKVA
jgi:putative FmdB family regulatory protein